MKEAFVTFCTKEYLCGLHVLMKSLRYYTSKKIIILMTREVEQDISSMIESNYHAQVIYIDPVEPPKTAHPYIPLHLNTFTKLRYLMGKLNLINSGYLNWKNMIN